MSKQARKKAHVKTYGTTLKTPVGRLVFPVLDVPKPYKEGQNKRYSATVVCNPNEIAEALINEINRVGALAFGAAWGSPGFYIPYLTAEQVLSKIDDPKEGTIALYENRISFRANSNEDKDPPDLRLADKSKLMRRPGNEEDLKNIKTVFYAGCFARFAVTPHSYFMSENSKGVALILKGVQFYKDGSKLGTADLEETFSEDFGDEGDWSETDAAFDEEVEENVSEANL